jgi:N-acetylneuraminic acid mutarotase
VQVSWHTAKPAKCASSECILTQDIKIIDVGTTTISFYELDYENINPKWVKQTRYINVKRTTS